MSTATETAYDLELTTPPEVPVLTLAQARKHLKVEDEVTEEDEDIQAALDGAVASVDGADGVLGRCLVEQQWTLYLDRFPCRDIDAAHRTARRPWSEIALPLRPLIAVDSIHYVDEAGVPQPLLSPAYQVLTGDRAGIAPAFGMQWPATRRQPRAVTIVFRAGHAKKPDANDPPDAADVPKDIVSAIKLIMGDLYLNREAQAITATRSALIENLTAGRLLAKYRSTFV